MFRQKFGQLGHTSVVQIFVKFRDLGSDLAQKCLLEVQTSAHGYTRIDNLVDDGNVGLIGRFQVPLYFQREQRIKLTVYESDEEDDRPPLDSDIVAVGDCPLSWLAITGHWKVPDMRDKTKSRVDVTAREDPTFKTRVTLCFSAENLDDKDFFSKSDPFLQILRMDHSKRNEEIVVLTTEVIPDNLNPTWKPISVPLHLLCDGDEETLLRIKCYDDDGEGVNHSSQSRPDFIGETCTSFRELKKSKGKPIDLINHRKTGKKGYKNSGTLTLTHYNTVEEHSLLDYILGGTQISVVLAIDFTYSNMDPKNPHSKHFLGSANPNQYEIAIRAALDILQHYDTDQKYYMLGFGAILNKNEGVNHAFFLPGDQPCEGIKGAVSCYKRAFSHIEDLSSPTYFAGVIHQTIKMTRQAAKNQYTILLILTDGNLSDIEETKEAIIKASSLPISIIIVGIGNDDFTKVRELDSDNRLLKSAAGHQAERDIVQFVSFKQIPTRASDGGRYLLAQNMLEEIPEQFMSYMRSNEVKPGPRNTAL